MHFVPVHLSRGGDRAVLDIIVSCVVMKMDLRYEYHCMVVDIREAAQAVSMLGSRPSTYARKAAAPQAALVLVHRVALLVRSLRPHSTLDNIYDTVVLITHVPPCECSQSRWTFPC